MTNINKNLQNYPLISDFVLLEEKMDALATLDNYHDLELKIEYINNDFKKYLKTKEFEEGLKKIKELLDENINSRLSKEEFSRSNENLNQRTDTVKDMLIKNKKESEAKLKTFEKVVNDLTSTITKFASKNDIVELANQMVSFSKKQDLRLFQDKIEPQITSLAMLIEK